MSGDNIEERRSERKKERERSFVSRYIFLCPLFVVVVLFKQI